MKDAGFVRVWGRERGKEEWVVIRMMGVRRGV
jgi:hypothetical protein